MQTETTIPPDETADEAPLPVIAELPEVIPVQRGPRLILMVLALTTLAVAVFLIVRSASETQTTSQAIRAIQQIALQANGNARGGHIGSWHISAVALDARTGDLKDFRLEAGPMTVAARTARVSVDTRDDTFTFDLQDVVYTRVPDETSDPDQQLLELDHYVLGPAPYGTNIVGE